MVLDDSLIANLKSRTCSENCSELSENCPLIANHALSRAKFNSRVVQNKSKFDTIISERG